MAQARSTEVAARETYTKARTAAKPWGTPWSEDSLPLAALEDFLHLLSGDRQFIDVVSQPLGEIAFDRV